MISTPEPTYHPIAHLFPRMSKADYAALRDDIKANGMHTYIAVWKGQIIDGRHRAEVCKELGWNWAHHANEIDESVDPVAYAVGCNLHRRQLDASQLAMVADKLRHIYEAEGKAAKSAGGGDKKSAKAKEKSVQANLPEQKSPAKQSRDKAAATVGVSGKLVDAARDVRTKGAPELAAAVERGEVAVTAAAAVARAVPQDKQAELVKSGSVKAEASHIRKAASTVKKLAGELSRKVTDYLKSTPATEEAEILMEALNTALKQMEKYMQD